MDGKEIKRIRSSYGLDVGTFALEIGYTKGYLKGIEAGMMPVSKNVEEAINEYKRKSVIEFELESTDIGTPTLTVKKIISNTGAPNHIDSCKDAELLFKCAVTSLFTSAEEKVYMAGLDTKGNLIGISEVSHGNKAVTLCDASQIMTRSLLMGASGIIIVHNHPSGDTSPSETDKDTTRSINDACNLLRINLLDHIIVSRKGYFSFDNATDIIVRKAA